jgi:hypothetical protein
MNCLFRDHFWPRLASNRAMCVRSSMALASTHQHTPAGRSRPVTSLRPGSRVADPSAVGSFVISDRRAGPRRPRSSVRRW